jgi:hypothetical protein
MPPPAHTPSIHAIRAEALFTSTLQRCDNCSAAQIRQVIAQTISTYGRCGCAGQVAQEFGDHPETAAARMRWARAAADQAFGAAAPEPSPRPRRHTLPAAA